MLARSLPLLLLASVAGAQSKNFATPQYTLAGGEYQHEVTFINQMFHNVFLETQFLQGQVTSTAILAVLTTAGLTIGSASSTFYGSTVTITSSGLTTFGGGATFQSRTIAQLQAKVPISKGENYFCSNCSPVKNVVSTGTAAGNFADPVGGTFK